MPDYICKQAAAGASLIRCRHLEKKIRLYKELRSCEETTKSPSFGTKCMHILYSLSSKINVATVFVLISQTF